MNRSRITVQGLEDARPGREAPPGSGRPSGTADSERRRDRRQPRRPIDEQPRSYYGLPVINKPVWQAREIAGYFFLGGLAGASSVVAAGAQVTGRESLARAAKLTAAGAAAGSLAALVKDLGRPERFLNMLRVFKPTSPMSVGTWLLGAYAPAALGAAASDLTGFAPGLGMLATSGAAILGPAVASYTGVLIADTAVPAWHDARRELPPLFVASAAMAAAGAGMVSASGPDAGPAQRLALLGVTGELAVDQVLERGLDPEVVRAYRQGRAHQLMRAARVLSVAGAAGAAAGLGGPVASGRGSRAVRTASGLALLAASACSRFGIFEAGLASAQDPAATVGPQRRRLESAGAKDGSALRT